MKTFHGFRIQIKTITKSKMNSVRDPSINMGKISGVILHSSLFQVKFQSSKFEMKIYLVKSRVIICPAKLLFALL